MKTEIEVIYPEKAWEPITYKEEPAEEHAKGEKKKPRYWFDIWLEWKQENVIEAGGDGLPNIQAVSVAYYTQFIRIITFQPGDHLTVEYLRKLIREAPRKNSELERIVRIVRWPERG